MSPHPYQISSKPGTSLLPGDPRRQMWRNTLSSSVGFRLTWLGNFLIIFSLLYRFLFQIVSFHLTAKRRCCSFFLNSFQIQSTEAEKEKKKKKIRFRNRGESYTIVPARILATPSIFKLSEKEVRVSHACQCFRSIFRRCNFDDFRPSTTSRSLGYHWSIIVGL